MLIGPIALLMFVFWQEVASPQERLTQLLGPGLTNVPLPGVRDLGAHPGVAPLAVGCEGVLLRAARPRYGGLVGGGLARCRSGGDDSAGPPV